ncbi:MULTISPECIES: hypothetical protein [Actinomadura]|uniref:Uncharacterized protein n=1 Tax=Actinomadura yumaensis TaxID=111807 RepID=A0ABW2CHG6_9ACTN|nr:hypothetical protein [Actinomadura sp. J1-007]
MAKESIEVVREGGARGERGLVAALAAELAGLLERHLHDCGAEPARTPVAMVVGAYVRSRVESFLTAAEARGARMLPSTSLGLEPVRLLQPFVERTGWHGPCYAICTPGADTRQAERWAAAAGRPALVVTVSPEPGRFVLDVTLVGPA